MLAGDDLAEVRARDEDAAARCVEDVLAAYEVGDDPPPEQDALLDVVD